MTKVAIGVPVYNGGKYLRECLDSLLRQTFTDWVCVINNNCSTDDTEAVAKEYVARDSRFKYFSNTEFLQVVLNHNRTFELTLAFQCEYFKYVPADDWLYPEYLHEMVTLMDNNPAAGMASSYRLDGVEVNCDGMDFYQGSVLPGKKRLIEELTTGPFLTGSMNTTFYRMATLRKLARFPMLNDPRNLHCDTELARDVMEISDFGFVYKVLSYSRRNNETYTSRISPMKTGYANTYNSLNRRRKVYPELNDFFLRWRKTYAYYLLTLWLTRKKDILNWHREHMDEKLPRKVYFEGLWVHNPLSRILRRLARM